MCLVETTTKPRVLYVLQYRSHEPGNKYAKAATSGYHSCVCKWPFISDLSLKLQTTVIAWRHSSLGLCSTLYLFSRNIGVFKQDLLISITCKQIIQTPKIKFIYIRMSSDINHSHDNGCDAIFMLIRVLFTSNVNLSCSRQPRHWYWSTEVYKQVALTLFARHIRFVWFQSWRGTSIEMHAFKHSPSLHKNRIFTTRSMTPPPPHTHTSPPLYSFLS